MLTLLQLSFPFAPEAAPVALITRRRYIRHQRKHVLWLQRNYCMYTLKEAAALLGLTPAKVLYLCRTHQIKKRAPNRKPHPKKVKVLEFAHNPILAVAA
ncbi:hypothetical protein [Hymenobacter sp. YC55]|uniref:hypothetical protein n=1 Tax=Hymenobacter sp. YC55 TaxID=3034019 RepID=UPI0023F7CAF4|nr:hypothetical protein [Hymenobacter sp. YC55]MDF7810771.1 hypothetical protein [Hymenobacter sp. YC55]